MLSTYIALGFAAFLFEIVKNGLQCYQCVKQSRAHDDMPSTVCIFACPWNDERNELASNRRCRNEMSSCDMLSAFGGKTKWRKINGSHSCGQVK